MQHRKWYLAGSTAYALDTAAVYQAMVSFDDWNISNANANIAILRVIPRTPPISILSLSMLSPAPGACEVMPCIIHAPQLATHMYGPEHITLSNRHTGQPFRAHSQLLLIAIELILLVTIYNSTNKIIIRFIFPNSHTENMKSLVLSFTGSGPQDISTPSTGLSNIWRSLFRPL